LRGAEIGFQNQVVDDRKDLRAGIEMFREPRDARVGVRREGGIVLIEVLESDRIFAADVVVEVGDGYVRDEATRAKDKCVVKMCSGGELSV